MKRTEFNKKVLEWLDKEIDDKVIRHYELNYNVTKSRDKNPLPDGTVDVTVHDIYQKQDLIEKFIKRVSNKEDNISVNISYGPVSLSEVFMSDSVEFKISVNVYVHE